MNLLNNLNVLECDQTKHIKSRESVLIKKSLLINI